MENTKQPPSSEKEGDIPVLLEFVEFTNAFRAIRRCIWVPGIEGRERNGEHTFQITLAVWFLNDHLGLNLNTARIIQCALAHDLVEIYADDTSCFRDPLMSKEAWLQQKETKKQREAESLERIEKEWGKLFPGMLNAMRAYEEQKDEESRFVYAIDKLISTINVLLDDGRAWKTLKTTLEEVDAYKGPRAHKHFAVGELYDSLLVLMKQNRHLFHRK